MGKENEVVKVSDLKELASKDINIKELTRQASAVAELLNRLNIKEATFRNGNYYKEDSEQRKRMIVTEGIIVEERENTYSITIAKDNIDENGVIEELEKNNTQKSIAAFLNHTQPWVSEKKNCCNEGLVK
ncbi:hypothetical protein [Clostridium guangxiense]|uniref:hypothetical protein n=1 Tax=Clostridium guangxiense TaxID=1662055 RepID=UPI001E3A03A9|nr:hypothetical protein [Clostridium guangxiense]MCD2347400.1 hypothetical protein [Clostridium guangxiense]